MGLVHNISDEFSAHILELLGSESNDFFNALEQDSQVSIRINPNKPPNHLDLDANDSVPWYSDGKYLNQRLQFTLDPLFHAGAYYVQEASSMFIGHILRQIVMPDWGLVIDLCAAPGGKSTLLLDGLPDTCVLMANEVTSQRLGALRQNLTKWGQGNVIATSYEASQLVNLGLQANLVLVDAPCSGEGMFRKDPKSIEEWSVRNVLQCAKRQKDILRHAIDLVAPGGYLIYSTCTYQPSENESQIKFLASTDLFEPVPIALEKEWDIQTGECEGFDTFRFYPHRIRGEGFFCSILRKKEGLKSSKNYLAKSNKKFLPLKAREIDALPFKIDDDNCVLDLEGNIVFAPKEIQPFLNHLYTKPLFVLGQMKQGKFVPDHGLAMIPELSNQCNIINVSLEMAQDYLRKKNINVDAGTTKGWTIIGHQGMSLGWVKILDHRINNYYPNALRIMNL